MASTHSNAESLECIALSSINPGTTGSAQTPRPILAAFLKAPRTIRRWLASRGTRANILIRKVGYREVLTAILLMIPSAATTMLTYYGVSEPMSEQGGGIVQKGQALAFAVTIGVFSWLGWFYLFGLLYRLHGQRLRMALAAGTFFVASIAAIDAPFNMLALGGGTAVQMTLLDSAESYEDHKNRAFQETTVMRQLLPAIDVQAERFRTLGEGEQERGDFSGSSGPGKVTAGFFQIATLLETLSAELKRGLDEAGAVQGEIADTLSEIKTETYVTGPLRPRVRRASIAADRLDDLLGQLAQYDYRISIEATLTSMNSIFPVPKDAATAFGKVQNDQLALIAEMARPVAAALQTALSDLSALDREVRPIVRPQNAVEAICTKWRELIFQWLAALFVDLAPGALLIILIAAFREIDAQRGTESPDHSKTED